MIHNNYKLSSFQHLTSNQNFTEKTVILAENDDDCSVTFILKTDKGKEYTLKIPSMMSNPMAATLTEKSSDWHIKFIGSRKALFNSLIDSISSIYESSLFRHSRFSYSDPHGVNGCEVMQFNPGVDPVIEAAYRHVRKRFNDPTPVSRLEIEKMYKDLFSPFAIDESLRHISNRSHPASIVYFLYEVFSHFATAPEKAMTPIGIMDKGKSGAYFLCSSSGEKTWVFKPTDEEPGTLGSSEPATCDGIKPGEGAIREHLADVINELSGGFFNIPKTVLIDLDGKVGSAQSFVSNLGSASKYMFGDASNLKVIVELGKESVQRSTLFDVIFGNGDRHTGNLLVQEMVDRNKEAVMIDQGMILSANATDPMKFDQAGFPQNEEFISDEIRDFVLKAPLKKWKNLFKLHDIDAKAVEMVDRHLTFFKACISASDESFSHGGLKLEMKDIAMMALMMHGDIVDSSDSLLNEYAQFITNLKCGLHEWALWKQGGQKTTAAAKFNRIRALMKFKPIDGLKMLGLTVEPSISAEKLSSDIYKHIIDPYLTRTFTLG